MRLRESLTRPALALCGATILGCHTVPSPAAVESAGDGAGARSRIAFSHALPRLENAHLEATVVEVSYGPGGSSPPHSHPCAVIGYVLEGALRVQVKGQPEATYRAGESFYEAPNGAHLVSANASRQAPVRFLAYFTCDHPTPLSLPVPSSDTGGGR